MKNKVKELKLPNMVIVCVIFAVLITIISSVTTIKSGEVGLRVRF